MRLEVILAEEKKSTTKSTTSKSSSATNSSTTKTTPSATTKSTASKRAVSKAVGVDGKSTTKTNGGKSTTTTTKSGGTTAKANTTKTTSATAKSTTTKSTVATTKTTTAKTTPTKSTNGTAKTASTTAKSAGTATKSNTAKTTTVTAKSTATKTTNGKNVETTEQSVQQRRRFSSGDDGGNNGNDGTSALSFKANKTFWIAIIVAAVISIGSVIGMILGIHSCASTPKLAKGDTEVLPSTTVELIDPSKNLNSSGNAIVSGVDGNDGQSINPYASTTKVGYYATTVGTVTRKKPVSGIHDEGLAEYPVFGTNLESVIGDDDSKRAGRDALIAEANYLVTTNVSTAGTYNCIDENGYLYNVVKNTENGGTWEKNKVLDSNGHHRQIYKHTAATSMYGGDISDSEQAVIKKVTMLPRGYSSYGVTGVYAPAGEVIKIEISEEDMIATGGITVHIGQALYNGQSNGIWTDKNSMPRMPHILNTFDVTPEKATLNNGVYTAYVGSYLGGPIYIRNESVTFSATISGGLEYSHIILGYTTKEEYEKTLTSSVPYFDLEVWNYGVLHSGPRSQIEDLSFDDLYKAGRFWEQVSSVTTTGSSQGIVFLYEPFVAAGAAVAFPGRSSVNCPTGWMRSSLDYKSMVESGSWGNLHEYHHNFQGYGVGEGGEVTNNGMTLVSYAEFTQISAKRNLNNNGAGKLSDWPLYTSATWALKDLLKIQEGGEPNNGKQGLALYATLLHNFGSDNYIQAKYTQQKNGYGESYEGYLKAWQEVTHTDMTYYFKEVLQGIDKKQAKSLKTNYNSFAPVSSVYQTGRGYNYDGTTKYFTTMQPYRISYGEKFTLDFSEYKADSNGNHISGSVVIPSDLSYRVLSITQPANGEIKRISDSVFEYTPDSNALSGQMIVTLQVVHKKGKYKFDNVQLVVELEQTHELNKSMLTRKTYTYDSGSAYTDAVTAYTNGYEGYTSVREADSYNPTQNSNTDIWYYDDNENNRNNYPNAPDEWFALKNTVAEVSGKLYFENAGTYRIYLRGRMNCAFYYSTDGGNNYYLGGKISDNLTTPDFRTDDENTYTDITVSADSWVFFKSVLIVQTSPKTSFIGLGVLNVTDGEPESNAKPTYATAYREDYEFSEEFVSDYYYTRKYTYTYEHYDVVDATQSLVSCVYKPWDDSAKHSINNLFDNNESTFIHSNRENISTDNPFELVVKLDKEVTANGLLFKGSAMSADYETYLPKTFNIWVSNDGANWTLASAVSNSILGDLEVRVGFDKYHTFSYYKVQVTDTHSVKSAKYIALDRIDIISGLFDGNVISPDDSALTYNGNWTIEQALSSFGHVLVGNVGDTVSFKTSGTNIAILTSGAYGNGYTVYIDGVKISSKAINASGDYSVPTFISERLSDGEHTVTIECKGQTGIDAIVIFD